MNFNARRTQRQLAEVGATVEITGGRFEWRATVKHPQLNANPEFSWERHGEKKTRRHDTLFGLHAGIRQILAPLRQAKRAEELTGELNTPAK